MTPPMPSGPDPLLPDGSPDSSPGSRHSPISAIGIAYKLSFDASQPSFALSSSAAMQRIRKSAKVATLVHLVH